MAKISPCMLNGSDLGCILCIIVVFKPKMCIQMVNSGVLQTRKHGKICRSISLSSFNDDSLGRCELDNKFTRHANISTYVTLAEETTNNAANVACNDSSQLSIRNFYSHKFALRDGCMAEHKLKVEFIYQRCVYLFFFIYTARVFCLPVRLNKPKSILWLRLRVWLYGRPN